MTKIALLVLSFSTWDECIEVSRYLTDIGISESVGSFEYNNTAYQQCAIYEDDLRPRVRPDNLSGE